MMINWIMEEESGQGMVEYGLILVLVSVVAIVALTTVGGKLTEIFKELGEKLVKPSGSAS